MNCGRNHFDSILEPVWIYLLVVVHETGEEVCIGTGRKKLYCSSDQFLYSVVRYEGRDHQHKCLHNSVGHTVYMSMD